MPDSKFDLGDYVEVKDRIKLFYELYGMGRLVTDTVEVLTDPAGKQRVMVKALAYRSPDDALPGVGHSWLELPGTTPYTRGSEVENAETSAWGRAIGSLGILIDRSIASGNEIRAKAGEDAPQAPETPHDGSLIGTVEIGKAPSDFELRAGPTGNAISFRLKDGRSSIKVVAQDPLASALAMVRGDILGQRVTCWGAVAMESFVKDGKTIEYRVLSLERIQTPEFTLPGEAVDTTRPSVQPEAAGIASQEPTATPSAPDELDSIPLFADTAA